MLTKEEHATLLRSFEVDRLLKLVTLEAKRLHDGHLTIFALTTHYQVAFGPPALASGKLRPQLAAVPSVPTLKEALIAALVEEKDVEASCTGALDAWWETQARPLTREDWTLIASVMSEPLQALEAGA